MRRALAVATAIGLASLCGELASALETDQYYAWGRSLPDAGAAIDAEVNSEILAVIEGVNARGGACPCGTLRSKIRKRFSYLIFLKPELWATNTSLVHKIPEGREDELRFRREYVYARHSATLDVVRWMPPSPTIEVNGIRFGTDKLSHFFSEGVWLEHWYRGFLKKGLPPQVALERAVLRGVLTEQTILGGTSSGVMSLADLEANYQGLVFWKGLCDPEAPALVKGPEGWRLARPFRLAAMVSPEWDESWEPNVYTGSRWKKVRPVLESYCGAVGSPEVAALRASYAARDTLTVTERIVAELLAEGKIPEPSAFTIDAVCGLPLRPILEAPGAGPHDGGAGALALEDVQPGGN